MRKAAKTFFVSFIPKYIGNKTVIRVYHMLTWIKVPRSVRERNYRHNLENLRKSKKAVWKDAGGCIENQKQWKDIWFGAGRHHDMMYSGCEIIAAFNAAKTMQGAGSPEDMAGLIRYFEAKGAALWGTFGTSPLAVAEYFKRCGFEVLLSYGDRRTMEAIERDSFVMIATVYNDKCDITKQIHTVCITRKNGYVLHNAYVRDRNGDYTASPSYETLENAIAHISNEETKLICLLGIYRSNPCTQSAFRK